MAKPINPVEVAIIDCLSRAVVATGTVETPLCAQCGGHARPEWPVQMAQMFTVAGPLSETVRVIAMVVSAENTVPMPLCPGCTHMNAVSIDLVLTGPEKEG